MADQYEHRPLHMLLIFVTIIVFLGLMFVSSLSGGTAEELVGDLGISIFNNNTGDVSDYYVTDITPAGWTFSIWGLIYVWQALWLFYALISICRKSPDGYMYVCPTLVPALLYIAYIINNGLNFGWLMLWDRFLPLYALIDLALIVFTLYICMLLSHRQLDRIAHYLISAGSTKDIWLIRILVHNGLAVYATWTTIATLLNLTIVLIYEADMEMNLAGTISLSALGFELLLWFILDVTVFDRYVRYTVMPYLVVVFALTGSIADNWDTENRNSYISAGLLGLSVVFSFAKIFVAIWRHKRQPLYESTTEEVKSKPV